MAAHAGNHAEGAAVVASVLDFQIWPRPLICRTEDRRRQKLGMGENIGNKNPHLSEFRQRDKTCLANELCQLMFMRVADDTANSRQRGDFLRGALGITAGNNNLPLGILTVEVADSGSSVPVSLGGYRTSINNHNVGFSRIWHLAQALIEELTLNCRAVSLGGPASEILHVKARHGSILT